MSKIRSHAKTGGDAYFKHTGGVYEVTRKAIGQMKSATVSEAKQRNLAKKGPNTAAAITTRGVVKALGL